MPLRRESVSPQDQVDALTKRIKELEQTVARLRQPGRSSIQVLDYTRQIEPIEGEVVVNHPGVHNPADATSPIVYFHDGTWYEVSSSIAGLAVLQIKVVPDDVIVFGGDGIFYVAVSEEVGALNLIEVAGWVSSAPTSTMLIQIRNTTVPIDMLSTRINIDAGEFHSKDAAVQPVVGPGAVNYGDILRIDIDAPSTSARGLGIDLVFG